MTNEEATSQPTQPRPARPVFSIEELSSLAPGLGTIMPDIGIRTWKLFYAAEAGNWPMANFQAREIRGLFARGAFTRPNFEADLKTYVDDVWSEIQEAIKNQNFAEFKVVFDEAVASANDYHVSTKRPYIVWKLPDYPPPDLDLTPH